VYWYDLIGVGYVPLGGIIARDRRNVVIVCLRYTLSLQLQTVVRMRAAGLSCLTGEVRVFRGCAWLDCNMFSSEIAMP